MGNAKKEKKEKKPRKVREVVEIEVGFDKAGHVETKDAQGNLIVGIPKKAFSENVPEKNDGETAEQKAARITFRHEAKKNALTYARDVAQYRLDNMGKANGDPKAKAQAKLDKLKAKETELLAIINAK